MKKIIALSALLTFGIGFTASAQQKKAAVNAPVKQTELPVKNTEVTKAAKKNVATLNSVVALSDTEKQMFQGLFETKYEMLKKAATPAEKENIYNAIEQKLRATFTADKMAKLDAKPEVLKALTHE